MIQYTIHDEDWGKYLSSIGAIESNEEKLKREKVVLLLEQTIHNFGRMIMKDNDHKKGPIIMKLLPFGSYALRGHTRHADIDLALICPAIVKRVYFKRILLDLLRQQATIQDVTFIGRANVPIIKCTVDSISIDISFIRLKLSKIEPNINLLDDSLLQDIEQVDVASMDGPRVSQFIQTQIKYDHIPIFQRSLQCIKHWATARQIYNKPVGYLNGSSWTFLLLKTYLIVKNIEQLSVTYLLTTFFDTWMDWSWSAPVLLTEHIPGLNGIRVDYQKLEEFQDAIMPIVSPCYPVSLATPYVTKSTLKIMTREFERASYIMHSKVKPSRTLQKLFNPINYFKRYTHYLCIVTSTDTANSHDVWLRKMAAHIPRFVTSLESCPELKYIQPVTKPMIRLENFKTMEEKQALKSGRSPANARAMSHTGSLQPGTLYLAYHFLGLCIQDSCTFVDLSKSVSDFIAILESKRNKNDDDVQWEISPLTKKQAAELLGVPTQ